MYNWITFNVFPFWRNVFLNNRSLHTDKHRAKQIIIIICILQLNAHLFHVSKGVQTLQDVLV